jgi:hypothetical protein
VFTKARHGPLSWARYTQSAPSHLISLRSIKVKVKLSLCFNWAPRHEGVLGEWRHSSTHSLTSALDGGEWLASRPGRFIPKERAPVTLSIGGWVVPRAGLDAVMKKKFPAPAETRDSPSTSPHLSPNHWAISVPKLNGKGWKNYYGNGW